MYFSVEVMAKAVDAFWARLVEKKGRNKCSLTFTREAILRIAFLDRHSM